MLQGLVQVDVSQLLAGVPPISAALASGRLRYIRRDPEELWMTVREIWERGGGDCEDLASAVAAELVVYEGHAAEAVLYRSGPRLVHVVTRDLVTGEILDPSITGGMET